MNSSLTFLKNPRMIVLVTPVGRLGGHVGGGNQLFHQKLLLHLFGQIQVLLLAHLPHGLLVFQPRHGTRRVSKTPAVRAFPIPVSVWESVTTFDKNTGMHALEELFTFERNNFLKRHLLNVFRNCELSLSVCEVDVVSRRHVLSREDGKEKSQFVHL